MRYEPSESDPWVERFALVAQRFQRALRMVVDETFEAPPRAVDLGRRFELNRTFASRLNRALSATNPSEVAALLPGRSTMVRLIERMASLSKSEETIREVREAYYAYLREVGRVASTQQELAAILEARAPGQHREPTRRQREAFFRASTDLVGGCVAVSSFVSVVWPNADDPGFGDVALAQARWGLRRTGTMDAVIIASGASENARIPSRRPALRLDGGPLDAEPGAAIVRELSSRALPPMRTVSTNDVVYSACRGDSLRRDALFDVVSAVRQDRWMRNIREGEAGEEQFILRPNIPAKLAVSDFIVHRAMWPGIAPALREFRDSDLPHSVNRRSEALHGSEVRNFDELRELSASELLVPIDSALRHAGLLRYVLGHIGVGLDEFRVYRHVAECPPIGQSVWVVFGRDGSAGGG